MTKFLLFLMTLDKINKNILNVLMDNSRLSFREVAKKVGVSVVTVLKRVKELEKSNMIKYTAELDYERLGYDICVIIKMRISKGKSLEVEKKISGNPHVHAIYDVTGRFDSFVLARFKSRKSMDNFLKKVQSYDFVERTETNFILNTIKDTSMAVE